MRRKATALLLGLELLAGLQAQNRDPSEDLPAAFAVERTSSGSIRLNLPASLPAKDGGSIFAGDPAVAQDEFGNIFVAARDSGGAIWVNTFDTHTQNWGSWLPAGGAKQGTVAIVATADGGVYLAARDRWNKYWITNYTAGIGAGQEKGFQSWTLGPGHVKSEPSLLSGTDRAVYATFR